MFKHSGQQEPVHKIMRSSGVCNTGNVLDHEGRNVYFLTSVHEISETLIHGISLVAPSPSGNDVLNEKPEHELVKWHDVTLLHCLWVFQPWLLTQPLG